MAESHRRTRRADRRIEIVGSGRDSVVDAIATIGNTVYFGGDFTSVGTPASGFRRAATGGGQRDDRRDPSLGAGADRVVNTMVVHPASGRVIVGGGFNTLNATQAWGMGSLDGTTGTTQPWAANTVIKNHDSGAAINSLTTDGTKIFGVGWTFIGGGSDANFEGQFSADPLTGVLDWIDAGRGDNYDIAVTGDVLYTVGHPHDAGMLDWNPQTDPWQFQRAGAINKHKSPTLTNAVGTPGVWGTSPASRRRSRCTGCRR